MNPPNRFKNNNGHVQNDEDYHEVVEVLRRAIPIRRLFDDIKNGLFQGLGSGDDSTSVSDAVSICVRV